MVKNSKKPRLRFKGFTDEWEQRKVSDLAYRYDNLRLPITAKDRISGRTPYYGANGIQDYVQGFTHEGEFVLIAEDGANDIKNYPVQYVNGQIWVNNHAHVLQANENNITLFIKYLITSSNIASILVGGGRSKLNSDALMNFEISIPIKQEQQKIAKLFLNLDNLITLHQRKYDKLLNVKKALLDKMFPKNQEKTPKIRFKGFFDAWEQRKVGEISRSYSGGTPIVSNKNYYIGDIPFIRSGEINSENTEFFINELALQNSSAKMIDKGDILYALYGATSGEVARSKLKGAINQAILAIKPISGYDYEFIAQWLRVRKNFIVDKYLQGGQGNLSGEIIKGLQILLPNLIEQQLVGCLFNNLDNLITLHQSKCEKLKNIKKALLDKMFV